MRILSRDEYRKLLPRPRTVIGAGKRMRELMAFHSSDAKYGELQRFSSKVEVDRNCYNNALSALVKQKTILPDTLKIHASRNTSACVVENLRVQEE